ncbi:MAG: aldehyde dehydrogenase family protein [Planctomycetota bacterium]
MPVDFHSALGLSDASLSAGKGDAFAVTSPIDGRELAAVTAHTVDQVDDAIAASRDAFMQWRAVPAPRRGELVRRLGNTLREHKTELGRLVSIEVGKITAEAEGEVQEMIDICDFAVGLSRQVGGLTIPSERPDHHLLERWHPLGPIGVITAFNFPVAVWAWNAALALVCGDPIVWKPSEKAPLCAVACDALLQSVVGGFEDIPPGGRLNWVVQGRREVGERVAASEKLPLISATGSIPMGKAVAQVVGARLGRSLLELGGNNAMLVTPSADLELAVRAITFSAVGTAGQRCTSLRRLFCHRSVTDDVVGRLEKIYGQLSIGDPTKPGTLVGPLIDAAAAVAMDAALEQAKEQGGAVFGGGRATGGDIPAGGAYVKPAIVRIDSEAPIVACETFAPILYVLEYDDLNDAIARHNAVPQGLSSAIFTNDVREAERFLSATGSDCGIANVNIGTSGAEIGGAFGGEKDTGGGRESGSDAWKAYMRRCTQTVNYGRALPLAQGINFDV